MKKLTHEEWISKYKDTIKVKVLGKYINNRTKIKCECRCGNIKEMAPNHIRRGALCKQGCHRDFYSVILLERLKSRFHIIDDKPEKLILVCKKCNDKFHSDKVHNISCNNCNKLDNEFYTVFEEKYKDKFKLIGKRKTIVECRGCSSVIKIKNINNIECRRCSNAEKYQKYFNILNNNGIKIIPDITPLTMRCKEKYKFICSCGNETFNTIPRMANVLNCAKCRTYGTRTLYKTYFNRETILYYVRFGQCYKIGVTLKKSKSAEEDIHRRFSRYGCALPDEIVKYKVYANGFDAYQTEQFILNKYSNYRLIDPAFGGGWSEVFKLDVFSI